MKLHQMFTLVSCFAVLGTYGCAATATPMATATPSAVPSSIAVGVASDDFQVGAPRLPFVLLQGGEPLAGAQAVRLTAFDLSSGTPIPGWTGEAASYSDYEIPYWVAYPDLPHAGAWGLLADVTLPDDAQTRTQFTINVLDESSAPAIGETVPPSQNRTLEPGAELSEITSDPRPEPGLYQLSVADAVQSGKPTVVTIATPAFCTSRLCTPVVDSVKAVYGKMKDSANFIHIEVYATFDPLVYAPEMDEWQLTSEPWTFVVDRDGKVAARLGGPVSPRELEGALAPLVQP